MKLHITSLWSFAIVIPLCTAMAMAQPSIVYPAAGQSPQQQAKDQGECNAWAQTTTGVNPTVIAQQMANQPAPTGPQGSRVRGALGGAAAGAIIGEVASNDAGKGAAIGAVVGTMAGGRRERQRAEQQQAAAQGQQQQAQQALDTYNRAVNACMQGRQYVIN